MSAPELEFLLANGDLYPSLRKCDPQLRDYALPLPTLHIPEKLSIRAGRLGQ